MERLPEDTGRPQKTAANGANSPTVTAAANWMRSGGAEDDPSQWPAEQRRAASLPEVRVENVGLHIGGEPNTPEAKASFLRAVAEQFREFRLCYRLCNAPGKGGLFGVDLKIRRGGGTPEVSQSRTGMGGPEFRACVLEAFRKVRFVSVPKPTMVSYSLRFVLDDHSGPSDP